MLHIPFMAAAGAFRGAVKAPTGEKTAGALAGAIQGGMHGLITPKASASIATRILGPSQGKSSEFHDGRNNA